MQGHPDTPVLAFPSSIGTKIRVPPRPPREKGASSAPAQVPPFPRGGHEEERHGGSGRVLQLRPLVQHFWDGSGWEMLSRVPAMGSPGPGPRRAVCHRPPGHGAAICPERGNGSAQPFTSPARRLTESIRQDRPSASPPPPLHPSPSPHPPLFLSGLYTS